MRAFETRNLGKIWYEAGSEIEFPYGLPGFEERRRFVAMQYPDTAPLIFLQNLEDPNLCFIALPVLAVDPTYELSVSGEDLERIGLSSGRQPRIGTEVLCLTMLSIRETGTTANLLAPVVVNIRNLKAVQAVAQESAYSHRHALEPQEETVCS